MSARDVILSFLITLLGGVMLANIAQWDWVQKISAIVSIVAAVIFTYQSAHLHRINPKLAPEVSISANYSPQPPNKETKESKDRQNTPMSTGKLSSVTPSGPDVNEERPIDFAIVTALEEERVAVLNKLPDHRKLEPDGRDVHVYYEAEVKTRRSDGTAYRIIVTSLSGMGPIEAASKAKDLVHRWHPSQVLLVGIAGGVSGEVALGDVLVASQIADYTLGKVKADVKREVRWEMFRVDPLLFSAAHNFPRGWEDLIVEPRPDPGLSQRRSGVIASGGDVIAYPALITDYKLAWGKLIGVDMEGGGLASALHGTVERPRFLMIRGVSDFADADANTETKAKWRKFAADVAAAYTIGLLRDGPSPGKSNARNASQFSVASNSHPDEASKKVTKTEVEGNVAGGRGGDGSGKGSVGGPGGDVGIHAPGSIRIKRNITGGRGGDGVSGGQGGRGGEVHVQPEQAPPGQNGYDVIIQPEPGRDLTITGGPGGRTK